MAGVQQYLSQAAVVCNVDHGRIGWKSDIGRISGETQRVSMKLIFAVFALVGSAANAQSSAPATTIPQHIAKIVSRADGKMPDTAYRVGSVQEEYEILKVLGLTSKSQALVVKKKPYDVLTAVDPATGSERQVWFDISSFYPEF